MRWKIASALALLLAATLSTHAAPLAPATIPDTAKWVMHLNVDAARGTALWEVVRIRFIVPRQDELRIRARGIENATGMVFPRDLHDVTLYGTGYDDGSVCILLHAAFDQPRTLAFLKTNPKFASVPYNNHAIVEWLDQGRNRLTYGAFVRNDIAIVASNPKAVSLALDTLDGKAPALKPNSPLVGFNDVSKATSGAPAGPRGVPIFWVAGIDLSELPQTQRIDSGPFLMQMDDARLGVSLAAGQVNAKLVVTAKSEQFAQQLTTSAEGVKAMLSIRAADEHALPQAKLATVALKNLNLATEGRVISADLSIGINNLDALLEAGRGPAPLAARGGPRVVPPPLEGRGINRRP